MRKIATLFAINTIHFTQCNQNVGQKDFSSVFQVQPLILQNLMKFPTVQQQHHFSTQNRNILFTRVTPNFKHAYKQHNLYVDVSIRKKHS